MRMQNVFIVSVRQRVGAGELRGPVVTHLFCCVNEGSMRVLVAKKLPGFELVSAVSLAVLQGFAKKSRDVLAGVDSSWNVVVEAGVV